MLSIVYLYAKKDFKGNACCEHLLFLNIRPNIIVPLLIENQKSFERVDISRNTFFYHKIRILNFFSTSEQSIWVPTLNV